MTIDQAVINIKSLIETAILTGGTRSRNNLIRTSLPIRQIHELVKDDLVYHGVRPDLIHPKIGQSKGELKLSGFIKTKNQDIAVVNPGFTPRPEELLTGKHDKYGHDFTEHTLSINIRSQLSSTAKNFDTLYERSFAESLNLHMRCPNMVLGEVFMIAIKEYDQTADNVVSYIPFRARIKKQLEKYVHYYSLLNNRSTRMTDFHKYERVCLLLVDFSTDIPRVYNTTEELIDDGLLPRNTSADVQGLSYTHFIQDLVDIYIDRFGLGILDRQPF